MATTVPAVLTALIGFLGVTAGVVVTGRREERKWFREQKLRGLVDFVTATNQLFENNCGRRPQETSTVTENWTLMSESRATIYLLCRQETIDAAELMAKTTIRASAATGDDDSRRYYQALRDFNSRARRELTEGAPRRLRPAPPVSVPDRPAGDTAAVAPGPAAPGHTGTT